MRKMLAFLVAIPMLTGGSFASAYDTSRTLKRGSGPTTVALIPFADDAGPELANLVKNVSKELVKKKGVRLMDVEKTNSIVSYYNLYVKRSSAAEPVQGPLMEARRAILYGDYRTAADRLSSAEAAFKKEISAGRSNEGVYQLSLLRAKVHHANKDEGAVIDEYEKIVRLNPYFELDPDLYGKWERDALKAALAGIEKERTGSLRVASAPEGSELLLNGFHMGITPMTLERLPSGRYCVEVRTVNYAPHIRYVDLGAGEQAVIETALDRDTAAFAPGLATVPSSWYRSDQELSKLVSTLGYHIGVDKVVLVSSEGGMGAYRAGDVKLGAVYKIHDMPQDAKTTAEDIYNEVRADIMKDPQRYVDRTVGSPRLHQKSRLIYQRPVFWFIVGAGVGAGIGGALGAILAGGGGAAAASGGIVVGL